MHRLLACYFLLNEMLLNFQKHGLCKTLTFQIHLRLFIYIADVAECSRALDIRLSDWCCSVSMVWVQIPSRGEQIFVSSNI